jgi:hypothetical protein
LSDTNEKTRVHDIRDLLPVPPARPFDAHAAFLAAYDRLNSLARIARGAAVLVVAVAPHARVVESVIVESGHSLVIGRHTHCGFRLRDETISLRHLVAHAEHGAPGAAPALRLWDLNTAQFFLTEDGEPTAAVKAEGVLYAALGPYALLFVPTRGPTEPPWPARAEEAWSALPPRQFIERQPPNATRMQHARAPRRLDGQDYYTPIHRMAPLLLLGEHEGPQDAWGELMLEQKQWVSTHHVSLARLEQGVLLGRYERCGIPLGEMHCLSRVHLLLVRLGEEVLAIDTASTNGTCRGALKLDSGPLGEQDSLTLAGVLQVHWRRLHN